MSIPQRLYNEIMMLDDFTCVYCGKRTPDVEVDHIIPRSVGGPDVLHNLVAACPECNIRKRDRQLHEAKMRLQWGRFDFKIERPLRKSMAATQQVREDRLIRVRELAVERNDEGWYKYSANAICKAIGGASGPMKAEIAKLRAGQPVNTRMKQQVKESAS